MHALDIQQLSKTYANGFQALKAIDLQVEPGEFFGLLGPNGAGKSTSIGIVSGLVLKSSGKVRIFDQDLDDSPYKARRYLGLVPQEFNFNLFENCRDVIANQAGYYGLTRSQALHRADELLEALSLSDKAKTPSRMLSGGMKRRLMIARALAHRPKLLILDEPTAGVDIELRRSMWNFLQQINREGTSIILTTHYLEEAESLCNRIAIINQGRIIENAPTRELLQKLHQETFIFDCAPLASPYPDLSPFSHRYLNDHQIEVDILKGQSLNALFEQFNRQQIQVSSLRNKANRLEELFLKLVDAPQEVL